MLTQAVVAATIATLVARRGLKHGSLSKSGAIAAWIVGFVAMFSGAVFGVVLLAFYFSGSAFTKYKSAVKKRFDLEHRPGGGQRDWTQVLATAGFGTLLCVFFLAQSAARTAPVALYPPPLDVSSWTTVRRWSPALDAAVLVGYLASYACVCGDTWASELGVLATRPPVHLVHALARCKVMRVPRGTNGGVSAWGTLMSVAGGAFVGAIAAVCIALPAVTKSVRGSGVTVLDAVLYGGAADPAAAGAAAPVNQWHLVAIGAASGLVGSFIDSVIGALLQRSWIEESTGKVTSRLPPGAEVSSQSFLAWAKENRGILEAAATDSTAGTAPAANVPEHDATTPQRFVVVCGYDVLSNEQVNAVSSAATGVLAAAVYAVWGAKCFFP